MRRTKVLLYHVLEGKQLLPLEQGYVAYNVFEGQKMGQLKRKEQIIARIRTCWDLKDEALLVTIQQMITQSIAQIVKGQAEEQAFRELKRAGGERL